LVGNDSLVADMIAATPLTAAVSVVHGNLKNFKPPLVITLAR
jgi:hypothetical protein